MRRYYISQRFCITICVGITFRNVYYIMRFNTRTHIYVHAYTHIYAHIYKGIRFIVLYPPKCSHDLPPLAGLYTRIPFQSPEGYFRAVGSIKRTSSNRCLHSHTQTYIYTYKHTYTHTCMHAHTYIRTYVQTCMHACMYACMHTYIRTYIHTYIHA